MPAAIAASPWTKDGYKYLRLEFDGDQLVGALGIGLTDHVGVIRGLIQNQTALAEWKGRLLENPHRVMEAYVGPQPGLNGDSSGDGGDGGDASREDAMKVSVKLYALLSDYLPAGAVDNQVELELPEGTTPEDVFAKFNLPRQYCSIVLVNGVYVEPSERGSRALGENDTLAIWPPVAGG